VLEPGKVVVLYLLSPSEKYFGELLEIGAAGIILRGINLGSFEDWMRAIARDEPVTIGPSTVFFPLLRVERLFLDEPVGQVESMTQLFERRVGESILTFLRGDLEKAVDEITH
jgi:hypothetical protein